MREMEGEYRQDQLPRDVSAEARRRKQRDTRRGAVVGPIRRARAGAASAPGPRVRSPRPRPTAAPSRRIVPHDAVAAVSGELPPRGFRVLHGGMRVVSLVRTRGCVLRHARGFLRTPHDACGAAIHPGAAARGSGTVVVNAANPVRPIGKNQPDPLLWIGAAVSRICYSSTCVTLSVSPLVIPRCWGDRAQRCTRPLPGRHESGEAGSL